MSGDWSSALLTAIDDPSCTRDDVAVAYADAIPAYGLDSAWREINAAITARWSLSGLRYIKEKAWMLATNAAWKRATEARTLDTKRGQA